MGKSMRREGFCDWMVDDLCIIGLCVCMFLAWRLGLSL